VSVTGATGTMIGVDRDRDRGERGRLEQPGDGVAGPAWAARSRPGASGPRPGWRRAPGAGSDRPGARAGSRGDRRPGAGATATGPRTGTTAPATWAGDRGDLGGVRSRPLADLTGEIRHPGSAISPVTPTADSYRHQCTVAGEIGEPDYGYSPVSANSQR